MDFYYDLKMMLCKELEQLARKRELSAGDLDVVDKLTHSIKSIVTIMAMEEGGYSYERNSGVRGRNRDMNRYTYEDGNSGLYYDDGGYSNRRYYDGGYSGRRYSREEGKSKMIQEFEKLMDDASTPDEREILQSAISKLKNM